MTDYRHAILKLISFSDPTCQEIALISGGSAVPDDQITGTLGTDGSHGLDKIRLYTDYPVSIDTTYWKSVTTGVPTKIEVHVKIS